jgi:predicted O-methyltransferase YrrM
MVPATRLDISNSSSIAVGSAQESRFRKPRITRFGRAVTVGRLYNAAVRRFLNYTFPFWQSIGIHAVPVHFYYPIPDTRRLGENTWTRKYPPTGLDLGLSRQLDLLREFEVYRSEYDAFPIDRVPQRFYVNNRRFESVDAEVFYCMIRHLKPRRIYEIGSGFSTLLASQAISANEAAGAPPCEIVAIEPYPSYDLLALPGVRILRTAVEEIALEEFDKLEANDILFIDSSHTIRTGGDVVREYLEILPRLKPGVLVHCHDIFLPADYPRRFVIEARAFWDEQYLVHAFLLFNNSYEVQWTSHYLHLEHPETLHSAFASYGKCPTAPSSLWLKRVAAS